MVSARNGTSRELRREIESILADDAEFDAFCAALFSDTKQYFTDSMNRQQKINTLLDVSDHEELAVQLHRYFQSDPELPVFSVLGNYLRSLGEYCADLPYVGFSILLKRQPRLAEVYVQQRLYRAQHEPDLGGLRLAGCLAAHKNLIIIADAGMGKSSFVRMAASRLAQNFRQLSMIPVLVSARGLADRKGSLPEALADQLNQELGSLLAQPLTAAFFTKPRPASTSWVFFIDGFDEIPSERACRQFVKSLSFHAANTTFRGCFVVTSRPHRELENLTQERFEALYLKGFTPAQVKHFVQRWPAPEESAKQARPLLMSRMREGSLNVILQTPLMLTLATLLQGKAPLTDLPTRATTLFERFVTALLDEGAERGLLLDYQQTWSRRFGTAGESLAEQLFTQRRTLIEELALRWAEKPNSDWLGIAQSYMTERLSWSKTMDLDAGWLREVLAKLLLTSGLLVQSGEQLRFAHSRLQEYLHARALASRYHPKQEAAWELVQRLWQQRRAYLLGLLFDLWLEATTDPAEVTNLLMKLKELDADALEVTAHVLGESDKVPAELCAEVVRALFRQVWNDDIYLNNSWSAIRLLGQLRGNQTVANGLFQLLASPHIDAMVRCEAAGALGRIGWVPLASQALMELAANDEPFQVSDETRSTAAMLLGDLQRGEELQWLCKHAGSPFVRLNAACALTMLGEEGGGIESLRQLAEDETLADRVRIYACDALDSFDRQDVALPILNSIGQDDWTSIEDRESAAAVLENIGQVDAAGTLRQRIAREQAVDALLNREALDEVSAAELRQAVRGRGVGGDLRIKAAKRFAELDHPEDAHRLLLELSESAQPHLMRLRAAYALQELSHHKDAARAYYSLAKASDCSASLRVWAVSALSEMTNDDARGPLYARLAVRGLSALILDALPAVASLKLSDAAWKRWRQLLSSHERRLPGSALEQVLLFPSPLSDSQEYHLAELALRRGARGPAADFFIKQTYDTFMPLRHRLDALGLAAATRIEAVAARALELVSEPYRNLGRNLMAVEFLIEHGRAAELKQILNNAALPPMYHERAAEGLLRIQQAGSQNALLDEDEGEE